MASEVPRVPARGPAPASAEARALPRRPPGQRPRIRSRAFVLVLSLALGSVGSTLLGLWIASGRLSGAAEPLLAMAAVSAFGTLAIAAVLWMRFDDSVTRPLDALAAELRARAHGEVDASLDPGYAEALGEIGNAVSALCQRLREARGEANRILAESTAQLCAERAQLSAILSELPVAVMAVSPDDRVLLYDRQSVALLGEVAPLGLGRPVTDYFAAPALREAVQALDLGGAVVGAELQTADGLRRVHVRVRSIDRDGSYLLAMETENETLSERPLVFDFDLLRREASVELAQTPLGRLSCVVFDTETTGLSTATDEIVQIGAVRIVNGRRIEGETFETLVDPGRPIPPASTRVHGIDDPRVAGAPRPVQAVRAFHRFAEGSILAAHNAPFDLAFLRRHAGAAGLRFDHGILDTVLLSAAIYGQRVPHTLDAIAGRLGLALDPEARHTASGDAMATAEVLLRLVPVLEAAGIRTFGEAVTAMRRHQRLLPDLNA